MFILLDFIDDFPKKKLLWLCAATNKSLVENVIYCSISKDSNIRVWDLQDFTCKQSIHGRMVNLGGPLEITAAFFNNRHKELIIASNKIGIFKPSFPMLGFNKKPLPKSHQKPVVQLLYNKLYNLVSI